MGINWSNPITRDLVVYATASENGFSGYLNILGSTISTPLASTKISGLGKSKQFSSNGTHATAAIAGLNQNSVNTILVMLPAKPAANSGNKLIFELNNPNGNNNTFSALYNSTDIAFMSTGGSNSETLSCPSIDSPTVYIGVNYSTSTRALFCGGKSVATGVVNIGSQLGRNILVIGGGTIDCSLGLFGAWNRALSAAEIVSISANPWQIFAPIQRTIFIGSATLVSITRPSSDITVTGWTSTAATLFDAIDGTMASDTDYITSPTLPTANPAIMGLTQTLAAGTWNVRVRANSVTGSGNLVVKLLDSGGTTMGTSSTQAVTGTYTTYTLSITTTGTADRVRLEVTP